MADDIPNPSGSNAREDAAAACDAGAAGGDDTQPLSPFPDHRDLYLIIAGVLLGLLLSGAVLGNIAPSLYNDWFVGGQETSEQIESMRAEQRERLDSLAGTGVSRAAVREQQAQFQQRLVPLQARLQAEQADHLRWLVGRMNALILAILAVMVLEVVASPTVVAGRRIAVPPAVSRLITVRYALIAMWLALALARPSVLRDVPVLFTALVVLVALTAAFVPLGRRPRHANA